MHSIREPIHADKARTSINNSRNPITVHVKKARYKIFISACGIFPEKVQIKGQKP
jgi:hypothetical protein